MPKVPCRIPTNDRVRPVSKMTGALPSIRERQLTSMRPKDGIVKAVRLVEDLDGIWTTHVCVSWHDDEWLIVFDYVGSGPRTYKSVALAVEHVRYAYSYFGRVMVETLRRADTPRRPKRRSDTF